MRFKNLTITLTLTCLSVVALAGLVLLPITNGICDWTGGKSSKSYTEEALDAEEQGWKLSASLSAISNSASGSVSPSIHTVGVFTSEKTYSGTANLRAYRNSGFKRGWVYCSYDNGCENYHNCPGHQQMVRSEAAEDPEDKVIFATVDMVMQRFVWGEELHWRTREGTGVTSSVTVRLGDYAEATADKKKFWWVENGVKYWESDSEQRINPKLGNSTGASASVKNYLTTSCGVYATFNFEHPTDGNDDIQETAVSVSYTGVLRLR